MPNINQIKLGSSASIINVAQLPSGSGLYYEQGTIFRVSTLNGALYRLTVPYVNATFSSGDFELFSDSKDILSVAAVGGSLSTKDGDVVEGVTVAEDDFIIFGTAMYQVGASSSSWFMDLDLDYVINTASDQVWVFNHQNGTLIRIDSVSSTYNADLIAGSTFQPHMSYQVFNNDFTIDVALMRTAAEADYALECTAASLVITLTNGTLQNDNSSPLFTSTTITLMEGDVLQLKKIGNGYVYASF
ncbi:MAG: hypothetical protein E6R13_08155 [Spirochaetes bacterium]|nr:MAG: hypothetical protein E6R13_08155 [Spirochaetota bacterium]